MSSNENKRVRSWCDGTGVCKECGRTGKSDATNQVLKAMGWHLIRVGLRKGDIWI